MAYTPKPIANPEQLDFIRSNMDHMSPKQIAAHLFKSTNTIYKIIRYINEGFYDHIPTQSHQVAEKFVRPPAVYDNQSHEDRINHWLNVQI